MRSPLIHADPRAARAALRHAHRTLASRIMALQAAGDAAFLHAFGAIVAAVEAGFRHDEAILETIGHLNLHACLEDNAVILGALHRVLPWVEQGNVELGRQVVAALRDVLMLRRLACEAALAASSPAPFRMRPRPAQGMAPGAPRARGHAMRRP